MTRSATRPAGATLAALLAVTVTACGGGSQGPGAPDPGERRRAFRERLQLELGRGYDQPLPALDRADFARGAEIYGTLCESCHGLAARGNGPAARALVTPPADLADPQQAAFFSDRAKLRIVEGGSPGTPMVGWRQVLTEEECEVVLKYMLDLAAPRGAPGEGERR